MRRPPFLLALLVALGGCEGPQPATDARTGLEPTAGEEALVGPTEAEALRTLPYATWVPVADDLRRGVTVHDPARAQPGLNLFAPYHLARAFLVDMDGRTVHSWSARVPGGTTWQHVELLAGGDLVALDHERMILRLDASSQVKWIRSGMYHHDLAVDPQRGCLWAIERTPREVEVDGETLRILDDRLVALDAEDGSVLSQLSVWDLLLPAIPAPRLAALRREWAAEGERALRTDAAADVFHVNSVELLAHDAPPIGKLGDLLISVRELDTIAVVDPDRREVGWRWGSGVLQRQHHPSLRDNGHLLVFDNRPQDLQSRVLEIDPQRQLIVWDFHGRPYERLFSQKRGGAQRLANGNTLVTESDKGRAIEVTRAGEVVWEYLCPTIQKTITGRSARAVIFRLTRIDPVDFGIADWAETGRHEAPAFD